MLKSLLAYKMFARTKDKKLIDFLERILKPKIHFPTTYFTDTSIMQTCEEDLFTLKNFLLVMKELGHINKIREIARYIMEDIETVQKIELSEKKGLKYIKEYILYDYTVQGKINTIKSIIKNQTKRNIREENEGH